MWRGVRLHSALRIHTSSSAYCVHSTLPLTHLNRAFGATNRIQSNSRRSLIVTSINFHRTCQNSNQVNCLNRSQYRSISTRPPTTAEPTESTTNHIEPVGMNVTKDNFAQAYQELIQLLPTASFIGIDEEMTGIHMPNQSEKMDDTTEERYQKMKLVAENYKIIQIGLCLFHLDTTQPATSPPRYLARPYNFYLFPEEGAVNMEASAILFNKAHGMDFNKWIYEGIPYVTEAGEKKIREKFYGTGEGWERELAREAKNKNGATAMDESKDASASSSSTTNGNGNGEEKKKKVITLEKESDVTFVEGVKQQIQTWCATRTDDDHELLLPECNSFLRLALYQWFETVQEGSPILAGRIQRENLFLEKRNVAGQKWKQTFVLCHYTAAERAILDQQAGDKKRADYNAKVGFRLIWNELRASKRPVIVHNGFFDLLFMWTHFEDEKLPESLVEFKRTLGQKFSAGIYDTKFLSNSRQFMYPLEYWSKRVEQLNQGTNVHQLSADVKHKIATFTSMNVTPEALIQCRFRETHLEKLYLVLQKEQQIRFGTNDTTITSTTNTTTTIATTTPTPLPPLGGLEIKLADSFTKYAQVGQPGGDDSAAHEAGYDAYMTACIFAHFVTEAPQEELAHYLNTPLQQSSSAASSTLAAFSPWRNRIPLYRHLMALNLNCDSTGEPVPDSLVDGGCAIYLMKGFPADFKNEDILKIFEDGKYISCKRKMNVRGNGAEETKSSSAEPTTSAPMTDVGDETLLAAASSEPSTVIVTAPPKIFWIDDSSVFLSIPKEDAIKMDTFIANETGKSIPKEVEISKYGHEQ